MADYKGNREKFQDAKIADLENEINQTFEELFKALDKRRQELLSRLKIMKSSHDTNTQLTEAIEQLRIAKENSIKVMSSNLLGENLDRIKQSFDQQMLEKEGMKLPEINLDLVEFRSLSVRILEAIEEIDLIELLPEYVGRGNPFLKKCSTGQNLGEFSGPSGIAVDRQTSEIYIIDSGNKRIQILGDEGELKRLFKHDYLKAPYDICLSDDELFVTDEESYLLKFDKSGNFLNKAGSRGILPGCFTAIRGLCYEDGLVYVCDMRVRCVQIFSSDLKPLKLFGYGEMESPNKIHIHSNLIYVLSRNKNEIYCYNKDCQLQKTLKLTKQGVPMTSAVFFTAIRGLCYEDGLVYVCDMRIQSVQIFSSDLKWLKTFGSREMEIPIKIHPHHNSIYVLSRIQNEIYCYNKNCQLQKTIKLTKQRVLMNYPVCFTIDSKGNFIISDQSNTKLSEIRIFSPDGVHIHTLGRGNLSYLGGIELDNEGSIVCVNHTQHCCFQKY